MRIFLFTIIELIAVLVILAILALIVTPIVMSIINKAKTSANKRSIDAYGRSIELAIASHMLDTGEIPTSIDELTIEYNGDEVVCETTQINSDSTVYLAGCTVGGKSVEGYTYGREEEVLLLKKTPLTVDEVNQFGTGHINVYSCSSSDSSCHHTVKNVNNSGYGGVAYYSSTTCGWTGSDWFESGCMTDYAQSEIKYIVDGWKAEEAPQASEVRLITLDDLKNNLGYVLDTSNTSNTSDIYIPSSSTPSWVYNSNYKYWAMTPDAKYAAYQVWCIDTDGRLDSEYLYAYYGSDKVIRPVINLEKSVISS